MQPKLNKPQAKNGKELNKNLLAVIFELLRKEGEIIRTGEFYDKVRQASKYDIPQRQNIAAQFRRARKTWGLKAFKEGGHTYYNPRYNKRNPKIKQETQIDLFNSGNVKLVEVDNGRSQPTTRIPRDYKNAWDPIPEPIKVSSLAVQDFNQRLQEASAAVARLNKASIAIGQDGNYILKQL